MGRTMRQDLRGDSGSSLVEMAFAITILMTLVIGVMEGSLAVYTYHFISNAAREGVRYAIVRGATWTGDPWDGGACASYKDAGCVASIGNIQDYVKSLAFPGIDTNNITVTPTSYTTVGGAACSNPTLSGGGVDASKPPSCNAQTDLIEVKVTYNFPFSVPFVPSKTLTMSSTARMVVSQ